VGAVVTAADVVKEERHKQNRQNEIGNESSEEHHLDGISGAFMPS